MYSLEHQNDEPIQCSRPDQGTFPVSTVGNETSKSENVSGRLIRAKQCRGFSDSPITSFAFTSPQVHGVNGQQCNEARMISQHAGPDASVVRLGNNAVFVDESKATSRWGRVLHRTLITIRQRRISVLLHQYWEYESSRTRVQDLAIPYFPTHYDPKATRVSSPRIIEKQLGHYI